MYVQEESIYNLLPLRQEVPTRPPRHTSKHVGVIDPKMFNFGQSKSQLHATMGLPNGCNAQHPKQYLRSHEKAPVLPDPVAPTQIRTRTRGPVPRKDEAPVYGIQSNKNFITTNAVEVILSKPKKVPQEEFNWTKRPGFGSVPVYLKRNKARVQEEKEQFETYLRMRREPVEQSHVVQMSPEDRADLLRHLKLKWASVNDAFQKQPLSTDTEQKKHRKEELARALAEIEKDIKTLERGEAVMIVDA